ncbi:MAG: glycine cleavage system protein GcvH [Acidobacteria bacterium]|nr:glycine cleavage system protein GcvH [Acidobacteriota bacterium]
MEIPDDLIYAQNHEWLRQTDGTVRLGISDYAQDALGDIVFVDLPEVGTTLSAGDSFGEVESTKSVSEVYVPVDATITAVNEALDGAPELVNSDPYGDGWFIEFSIREGTALDGLMSPAAYHEFTE